MIENNGTPQLHSLIESLQSGTWMERCAAARDLSKFGAGAAPAISALVVALGHTSPEVRAAVAGTLRLLGSVAKTAEPALLAMLHTEQNPFVRAIALLALGCMEPLSEASIHALCAHLSHPNREVRRHAVIAFRYLGSSALPAVPILVDSLNDEWDEIVHEASLTLGHLGPVAMPILIGTLPKAKKPETREGIIYALNRIGVHSHEYKRMAAPALILALADPSPLVRDAAAWSLGRCRTLEAMPELRRLAMTETNLKVRSAAVLSLGRIDSADPANIQVMMKLLCEKPASAVRSDAATVLGWAGTAASESAPLLEKRLLDGTPEERLAAANALASVGAHSLAAASILVMALRDPNQKVRLAVAEALSNLGAASRQVIPQVIDVLHSTDKQTAQVLSGLLKNLIDSDATAPSATVGEHDVPELVRQLGLGVYTQPTLNHVKAFCWLAWAFERPGIVSARSACDEMKRADASQLPAAAGHPPSHSTVTRAVWDLEKLFEKPLVKRNTAGHMIALTQPTGLQLSRWARDFLAQLHAEEP